MNKRNLSQPFFLLLLPVFFVFHGYAAYSGFIRWTDCLLLLGEYLLATILLFLLFRWRLKDNTRAALPVFLIMILFLFFGNLHDFLKKSGIFLQHYSILLPLLLVLPVLLTRYLSKRPAPIRLARFLNLLFLLFILADSFLWAIRTNDRDAPAISPATSIPLVKCNNCPHPDIYLLLFDEYTGSRTLRQTFHYDNSGLDSFLRSEGFHLQPDSRANYTVTPFSMASMLNLAYLRGISHPRALDPDDYMHIFEPIRTSQAVNFLLLQGYTIVNYSPFDLPEHPSDVRQPFIATGARLITYRTLTDCVVRDLLSTGRLGIWLMRLLPFEKPLLDPATRVSRMNEDFLDGTMQVSAIKDGRPRFIYTHIAMPHAPFLFDSLMRRRNGKEVNTFEPVLKDYLGYLPYTNTRVRQLITTIKKNTGGKAVILFMSDHGFRYWQDNTPDSVFFKNQNAVYFPDGDYVGFYDSISNVNQFRVVFDKLFHLDLPLLKDSTILLQDKN